MKKLVKGLFPGSFDPITNGHMYIIEEASKLVDELHVVILNNLNKKNLVSVEQRIELIKKATKGIKNVKVSSFEGLTIHYAELNDCSYMFRGVRDNKDLEYENKLFEINHGLNPNISTVIIQTKEEIKDISSTSIKELISNKKDISKYVPNAILEDVLNLYSK